MYDSFLVYDHNIVAINKYDATIVIRKDKNLHVIDLNLCANNFAGEHSAASGKCVGDRNIERKYFCFHTGGSHTFIYFRRRYACKLFGKKVLLGNRVQRFNQLQKAISELGYTTYDLT